MRAKFDTDALGAAILSLVLRARSKPWHGARKRRWVLRQISVDADDRATWGSGPIGRLAEAVDGLILHSLLVVAVEVAVVVIQLLPDDVLTTLQIAAEAAARGVVDG